MENNKVHLETKPMKISFTNSNVKVSLSKKMLKIIGITEEDPEVYISYSNKDIVITKRKKEEK